MLNDQTVRVRVSVDASEARRKLAALAASVAGLNAVIVLRRSLAEVLTALAFVAGWLLVTAGIARLTSPIAWLFSIGILSISLGGWKLLAQFVWNGLYALTRDS
jgi:hypothetical protein